ncbi:unnamed protein product [Didymodactylos carnosus]|uniref:Uncharacterized protein n=1 Tax=Didymodactylos carnosus TaxID=1234261 RepID=A0A8S2ILN6_9BILA|nr:unnamed protein product [Didymodactylos carnosus]CAF3764956.1 unnamed protein product [Didymodactylos carnosus]
MLEFFYELEDKLGRIVTDNASNNVAAFDNLRLPDFDNYFNNNSDLDESDTENDHKFTLTIITVTTTDRQDRNGEEGEEMEVNSKDEEDIDNECETSGVIDTDNIVADLPDQDLALSRRYRWSSQFHTVKAVYSVPQSEPNPTLNDLNRSEMILTSTDRQVLSEFIQLLELFEEVTMNTQGENHATISCLIESLLTLMKERSSGLLIHFKIDAPTNQHSMSERFSDLIFLVAPILDACFEMHWLNAIDLTDDVKKTVIEKI